MIVEPVVIVALVAVLVLSVFGCGVFLGRRLERRYRLTSAGLTILSGYRTLEEQRRLTSNHIPTPTVFGVQVIEGHRDPRYGVDPKTGGEAVIE